MEKNSSKNNVKRNKNRKENKNIELNLENLKEIKEKQQVLDMYIEDVDANLNMIGKVGKDIKAIIPREEASSVVGDDGLVEARFIQNKKGKVIPVCIKEINETENGIELVMSKRILELKVRRWMYLHLKPGVKLKGVVAGIKDYAAFVDVGGGVTGILKAKDITGADIVNAGDIFRLGQRVDVVVKEYDKDTGRIELSYKDNLGSFEDNIKKFKEGDIVEGIVRTTQKVGIFVELAPNVVGVAEHVSGIEYGQKVLVSIRKINLEKKRVKLIIIG